MEEYHAYIGSKIILATFCIGGPARDQAGYKVKYPDGHESWCPQAVFEEAYRLMSDKEKELLTW